MRSFLLVRGWEHCEVCQPRSAKVYELIARRFLSIFYPAAVYQKVSLVTDDRKRTISSLPVVVLEKEGYLKVG